VERSDRAGDQGRAYVRLLPDRLASAASVCRQLVVRCWKRSAQSSVLALSVPIPPKLRVATAQTEHMPIYLRTFLRVLSSWVHWGEIVESTGSRPGLHDFSFLPTLPLAALLAVVFEVILNRPGVT